MDSPEYLKIQKQKLLDKKGYSGRHFDPLSRRSQKLKWMTQLSAAQHGIPHQYWDKAMGIYIQNDKYSADERGLKRFLNDVKRALEMRTAGQ